MIGVILAAGIGSRLRPLTNTKPKCLVQSAGRPILQYQIDSYVHAGVNEIIIVVGYEGQAVREYCKHIKDVNITIVENADYETTNNMYSLYLAMPLVMGRAFVLNNADLCIEREVVERLIMHPSSNAVAVSVGDYIDESMKVVVDADGEIIDISKQISQHAAYGCSIDFYKFSAEGSAVLFGEVRRVIEDEKNLKDWSEVAMQRLFSSGRLVCRPCDISGLSWVEVDNYYDLAASDRIFSKFDDVLEQIDTVVLDLDGTVYLGSIVVPGAAEAILELRRRGKQIFFVSNNSSRSKGEYVCKLAGFGICAGLDELHLSTDALVAFLLAEKVGSVYVLGTSALVEAIASEGIATDSENPEYVIIGYDTELTYSKLEQACKYINSGADILATHEDVFCPSDNGPIPDAGALLEMIRVTTGKSSRRVFGKPSIDLIKPLVDAGTINPQRTLVIGDRLHTDMLMAKNLRSFGLLVLSGETTREHLETCDVQPDFVLNSLADIYVAICKELKVKSVQPLYALA